MPRTTSSFASSERLQLRQASFDNLGESSTPQMFFGATIGFYLREEGLGIPVMAPKR